jgi:hypothetical protein
VFLAVVLGLERREDVQQRPIQAALDSLIATEYFLYDLSGTYHSFACVARLRIVVFEQEHCGWERLGNFGEVAVDNAVVSIFEPKAKPTGLVDIVADVAEIPDGPESEEFLEALSNGALWLAVSLSDLIRKFGGRLIQSFRDLIKLGRAAGQYI